MTQPSNSRQGQAPPPRVTPDVMQRLLAGEPAAFAVVYEAHRARLYTFLLRLTRDEHMARDLSQETWLKFATNVRRLEPESEPGAWLFSVARNLFRSQRRWVLLDRERLAEWGFQRTLGLPASPLREVANHELGRHVEQAIATLPLRYREVLLLVSVEGFESEQVCTMLDLKPATLRQRLSRARAMLRETIDFDEER